MDYLLEDLSEDNSGSKDLDLPGNNESMLLKIELDRNRILPTTTTDS